MAVAIKLTKTGGPDVLEITEAPEQEPGATEVWLDHRAVGVNYLDVMQRKGTAPLPLPNGLGLEGAGIVSKVGSAVTNVKPGDRVAYILGPIGSYASGRLYPSDRLIKLPDTLSFEQAAAVLFKGITAQYLLKSTYDVREGTVVLAYGAAGAVGQILTSWAKHLGAFVIGVVSKPTRICIQ